MALTTVPASLSATALTLTTAAQPNITSVGTLTGLTVSGNIAGTLTTAAQTNITSLGTLTGLALSGNITLSSASSPKITITDTTNTVSLLMYSQDADAIIGTYTNHPLKLFSNSGLALTLDTSQNATFAGTIASGGNITVGGTNNLIINDSGAAVFGNDGDISIGNSGVNGLISAPNGNLTADVAGNITLDADDSGHVRFKDGGTQYASIFKSGSGATIDTPSGGDLTLDVAGDIILDAGGAQIRFHDDGTDIGVFSNESGNFIIKPQVSDADLIIKGNDGGSTITALTLDMSTGGTAYFADDVRLTDNHAVRLGTDGDIVFYHDNSNGYLENGTGNLTLDVAGDIVLDAAGNDVIFKDTGTTFGQITNDSTNMIIYNAGSQMLKGLSSGSDAQFMGKLTVGTGSYTNSQYYASDVVINAANEGGLTIANSANSHASYIMFADGVSSGSEQYAGYIEYNHSADRMRVKSNGTFQIYATAFGQDAFLVRSNGNISLHGPSNDDIGSNTGILFTYNNQIRVGGNDGTNMYTGYQLMLDRMNTPGDGPNLVLSRNGYFKAAIGGLQGGSGNSTSAEGHLAFYTATTSAFNERMRIHPGGSVTVGSDTTSHTDETKTLISPNGGGFQVYNMAATNEWWIWNNLANQSGYTTKVDFRVQNSSKGYIGITGSTVIYYSNSDYRLKENYNYDFDATSLVKAMKPLEFTWKEEPMVGKQMGFLAHELKEVTPYVVQGDKDEMREDGEIRPQVVDQGKLVAVLTKALQEALVRIETLETEVTALKG